jgi:site-specific recombinase XerD
MQNLPSPEHCASLASFDHHGDATVMMWNALIGLMYGIGANPREISNLLWRDSVRTDNGRWTLTFRGRRGARTVPVLTWSAERLTEYAVAMEPLRPTDRIFTRARAEIGGALVVKELHRRSSVIGLSPAALPTTIHRACIRDLIAAGMALEYVADLIGAKDLAHFGKLVKSLFRITD